MSQVRMYLAVQRRRTTLLIVSAWLTLPCLAWA